MTTYNWAELRDHAINAFAGDLPGAALEETILNHFEREPARVAAAIDQIGKQVAAGKIRSGWAILVRELGSQPKDVQATDNHERAKQLALAETWLTNTGGYLDRDQEVLDELFSPGRRLEHWPELWWHIQTTWNTLRPRFVAAEAASIERQYEQAQTLRRLKQAIKGTGSPIDLELHAQRIAHEIDRARTAQDAHRDDWLDQLAATHVDEEAA